MDNEFKKHLAECVGLWLAEGDDKTKAEITFTNNCFDLISFFHQTIGLIYGGFNEPRLYVYLPDKLSPHLKLEGVRLNVYYDSRANKPYYIYRIADVSFVVKWKNTVKDVFKDYTLHPFILSGIFAGEGNIKTGAHSNRILRISQGKRNKLLENLLKSLNLKYSYAQSNRMYNFSHKDNWDIFAKYKIADLHPEKKANFWKAYLSYKELHYKAHFIKENLLRFLDYPKTARELALAFNRSPARIYDILGFYHKKGEILHYRSRSKDYWIKKDCNIIVISKIKQKYIMLLKNKDSTTQELARKMNVGWKAAFRRLSELQKLGLVAKKEGKWKYLNHGYKLVVV